MIASQEHRGHPSSGEMSRAEYTAQRIGACVVVLCDNGFSHDEAVAFIAGTAWEIGLLRKDTWHQPQGALLTVQNLLAGHAAKHWSLDTLDITINEIREAL